MNTFFIGLMDGCTLFYHFIILVAAYMLILQVTSEAKISLSQLWNCLGQNAAPWGRVGIGVTRTLVGGDPYLPTRAYNVENSTIFGLTKYFFSFGFRLHWTVSCSEFYLLNAYLKFMTYHIRIGF